MDTQAVDKATRIRELNDAFRKSFSGGKILMTAAVCELPDMVKAAALQKVTTFEAFTENNDPHGEHDFGSFKLGRPHVLLEDRLLRRTVRIRLRRSR